MRYKQLFAVLLVVLFSVASVASFAGPRKMKLKDAILKKFVSITGIGKGGASGKCLQLELQNISKSELEITVDEAMIFVPSDTNYQNLVAAGGESVKLEPGLSGSMDLEAFCGKSYARCPRRGLSYTFWKQGDTAMINTMKFMKENGFLNNIGQKAVWFFTNNHKLNTVYDHSNPERSKPLITFIAKQKKIPVPEYYTDYKLNHTPGQGMVVANTERHYVEMTWKNTMQNGKVNVQIYTADGKLYRQESGGEISNFRENKRIVRFDPKVDKGDFYIVLKDRYGNVRDRKEITID